MLLRAVVGGMTAEQVITERDRVTAELGKRCRAEMGKLGLSVDAVEIQQLEDTSDYIANLAAPHAPAVASQARIAQANADLEASEREREAGELKARPNAVTSRWMRSGRRLKITRKILNSKP
jgi:flotillin